MAPRLVRRFWRALGGRVHSRRGLIGYAAVLIVALGLAVTLPLVLTTGSVRSGGVPANGVASTERVATTVPPTAEATAPSTTTEPPASTTTTVPAGPLTVTASLLTAPGGFGITSGPDGNVWYMSGNNVVRVTPGGQVTVFPYADSLDPGVQVIPTAITTGPDGNLWFTMGNGAGVGRITPSGQVTEFPAPAKGMIVTGSDGALWFGSSVGKAVSRMTLGGTITSYPTTGIPQELAEGPDGAIWFTETGGLIGRLSPQGALSEFSAPENSSVDARAIIAGGDENLWFFGDGAVGRITTSGQVTQWPVAQAIAGDGVGQMARTADGRIWFVTADSSDRCFDLALLHPNGSEALWELTEPCSPFAPGLTAGPDGRLWLTLDQDSGGDNIGTIVPPAAS